MKLCNEHNFYITIKCLRAQCFGFCNSTFIGYLVFSKAVKRESSSVLEYINRDIIRRGLDSCKALRFAISEYKGILIKQGL